MNPVWTVAETRAAERAAGVAEQVLIDRAATAVARRAVLMLGRGYGARVLVAAGPGHNGADALWAGWRLRQRGAAVDVALPLGEPRDQHGAEPLRRLRAGGARTAASADGYDLVLDGVLGIGARAGDDAPWAPVCSGLVLAVDVPTGLDADTGHTTPATVRATVTVTFGALKPGLLVAADHAGLVEVADIGLRGPRGPLHATEAADAGAVFAEPGRDSHKYERGVVGVVAGSERYAGAAALVCRGAQRAGCGYVRLRAPRAVADAVRSVYPEVVTADGPADIWVVGPGLGTDDAALDALREVLDGDAPVVVDADGLNLLARHRDELPRPSTLVLTPHTGEFERLTGIARADAEADRVGVTQRAARDLGATVLLKGATTVVAGGGGQTFLNATSTPWLATAGTGDVLAGVVGAALLCGLDDHAFAVAAAAWLHGMAGLLAAGERSVPITALDVAEHLPAAIRVARR